MAPTPKPVKHRDGTIRWRVRFRLGKGGNAVSETFADGAEAQRFAQLVSQVGGRAAREVRNAYDSGETMVTCDQAFATFLAKAAGRVNPATLTKYERLWDLRIRPTFGAFPTVAVTGEQVELWIADLRNIETAPSISARKRAVKRGEMPPQPAYLSGKSIANVQGLFSSVLESEVRAGRLDRNVARGVEIPRTSRTREPVFLSTGEFARLLSEIPEEWQLLVSLVAATGMRWSEAIALRPSRFDLETSIPVVRITHAFQRGAKGEDYFLAPPKTSYSVRTVSLPRSILPSLYEGLDNKERDELLFQGPNGRLRAEWFYRLVWDPAVVRAGLGTRPRIHDLRHSHASWLIFQGVPLTTIQRRLGHSSIKVTSDIYGHLAPESWEVAAGATDLALSQAFPMIEA